MATEHYQELLKLVQSFEKDFDKFYNARNKEAGVRLRKHMQTLREAARNIRDDVQKAKSSFPIKREDLSLRNAQRNPASKNPDQEQE